MRFKKSDLRLAKSWMQGKGRKMLFYHRDVDGVCSGSFVTRFFPDFESMPREGPIIDRNFFKDVISKKPDLIVFVDIPVDQEWKTLEKMKKGVENLKLIILDHHNPEKNMASDWIVHINPRLMRETKNKYIPASYVLYEFVRNLGFDVKHLLWIACVGIIGDYGFEDCWEALEECDRMYPGSVSGKGSTHPKMETISEMIASVITLKGLAGAEKALKILQKAETPHDMKKHKYLERSRMRVEEEIERIMDHFERTKEVFPDHDLIIYEIKSRLNITSVVATKVTERHPDKVIIIKKKSEGGWKVSLRCQTGKTNVGDLAKSASRGIGSGGGHVKSAGAYVSDFGKFRKRFLEELGKK